jgi:tetratricopeptide (TPR) repeat protein
MHCGILATVCALVVGVYVYTAHSGYLASSSLNAINDYYNLLVQGFRDGQLNLKITVPPGLAQSADPYDPSAHARYGVLDMSYYRGKLYLYYGVTPAVLLFWPYVALSGHFVSQKNAVVTFCLIGFLTSVGLLWALWRRHFAEVSVAVLAAAALALGLATCTPSLLARCDVYEVSISCGYALTMLALAMIWMALHKPRERSRWLAAASLAYGLAVGARPSLLFGAVILLAPVALPRRERLGIWTPLIAATGPIALIGLGLMLYNALRFDNPFEFGWHYVLAGVRLLNRHLFSTRYLWFNFRAYFLEPARWGAHFPFVHEVAVRHLPPGYDRFENPYDVVTNVPLVWFALAVPLAWRIRPGQSGTVLRWFVTAVALLFGICASTVCLYSSATIRFEVDFLPALVLLAVIGILSVELALAPTSESRQAQRTIWRRAVRTGWGLLLAFSVAFNLLASTGRAAEAHNALGAALQESGQVREAIRQYEQALRLNPDCAEAHYNLGVVSQKQGRQEKAIEHWEQALRINPNYPEAHSDLGTALIQLGKVQEAMAHWEQAVRINPNLAEAHYNLGLALMGQGRLQEAIGHYEQALQIIPNDVQVQYNLGNALLQANKPQEAIERYEHALRIKSDFASAHYNLGNALVQAGRVPEAIGHYERALKLQPDFAAARDALARVRAVQ